MTTVDWGNVPTWISAVGSTGALSATVGIIWRDHRKAERADPAALSCWTSPLEERDRNSSEYWHDNVHAQNNAVRPLYELIVLTWSAVAVEFGPVQPMQRVLHPGESCGTHVDRPADPHGPVPAAVAFRDSDGTHWLRDLDTQTLHPRNVLPSKMASLARRLDRERRNNAQGNALMTEEGHFITPPPWRWARPIWAPYRAVG